MEVAVRSGDLPLMEWLMHNGFDPSVHGRPQISAAVFSGSLEIVEWMYDHGFTGGGDDAMIDVASAGHLDMISWFLEHKIGCDAFGAFGCAIINDYLDTAKYTDEHFDLMDCGRCFEESMMFVAANDKLSAVQWLIEKFLNDPGIDLFRPTHEDTDNAIDAAKHDNFDIMQYMYNVDLKMKELKWKRKKDGKRRRRGEVEE